MLPDLELVLQEKQELRQWCSLRTTSPSLKGPQCRWSATTNILGVLISSGMFNTPNKAPSCSWNTSRERASKVSRLPLTRVRRPSTWRNHQLKRKTQPCTTVFWVPQWLVLQRKQSANPLEVTAITSLQVPYLATVGHPLSRDWP